MTQQEILSNFSKFWGKDTKESRKMKEAIVDRVIKEAKKYLRYKYKDNVPDVNTVFNNFFYDFPRSDDTVVGLSDFYLIKTIESIVKDKNIIRRTCAKFEDDKRFWEARDLKYLYTSNKYENQKLVVHDFIHHFMDSEGSAYTKNKCMDLSIRELNYISNKLTEIEKRLRKKVLKEYVKGISNSITILDNLGVLDSQIATNNKSRSKMGLDVLCFSKEHEEGDFKFCLNDLKSEDFLIKLPLEKLALIHSQYYNRLIKVAESLGAGLFILDKSGELNSKDKEVDKEKALTAYSQYSTVKNIQNEISPVLYNDMEKYTVKGAYQGKRYVVLDDEKIFNEFFSQYTEFYSMYSNEDTNMLVDYKNFMKLNVTSYFQKDFAMETLLFIALEDFENDNWGYIPEKNNGRNSIERKKENILLGFDVEGFNMPVKLHFPYEKLVAFLKNNGKNFEIPEYMGAEDIEAWNGKEGVWENVGTSILMILSPTQRKMIINMVKEDKIPKDIYRDFIHHIECMQYPNNYKRISKWKDPNGRIGGRKYVNVLTGKEKTIEMKR